MDFYRKNRDILENYCRLVLKNGISMYPGQRICISAPPQVYAFSQMLAKEAYRMGASYVLIMNNDSALARERIENQDIDTLQRHPDFFISQFRELLDEDWAYISIENLEGRQSLRNADSAKITALQTSFRRSIHFFYEQLAANRHPWCVICAPGPEWASAVFSNDSADVQQLWNLLVPILRLDSADASSVWKQLGEKLRRRCRKLDALVLDRLQIEGNDTSLEIGLSQYARWIGGPETLPDGRMFFPNIPTEEVFTVPDRSRVHGYVKITRPVTVLNTVIKNIKLEFTDGKVTSFSADNGEDILRHYVSIDEGASHCGEIALVGCDSPIFSSGRIFHSTLYDENAACHIALGSGYPGCLRDTGPLERDEDKLKYGCNTSLVHTDVMISNETTSVTGFDSAGKQHLIMQNGFFTEEFA